uniref:C-type mannose receptor 2-like n=1 Tax=Scatophagus argus TaxID=75038 RepID=UPI001ED86303|nr:C-type mannose receptor 2-like [Scatophagus argus]
MTRLVNMTAASGVTANIWIGLKKNGAASWLWSVGATQTSHGIAEYTNWATLPDSTHNCGGMKSDGKWLSALCGTNLPFVCQDEDGSMYTVSENKPWRQAQEYCQLYNRDLVSVRSQTENQALQQILNASGPSSSSFWIGLFRDDWKWSDQSDSSFRYWESSQPNNDGACALYNPSIKRWYDRGCANPYPFYCYSVKVTRLIVRMEIKSSSFFDVSDSTLSEAILSKILKNFEWVKLHWRVQPGGKVFSEKQKKKISEVCVKVT